MGHAVLRIEWEINEEGFGGSGVSKYLAARSKPSWMEELPCNDGSGNYCPGSKIWLLSIRGIRNILWDRILLDVVKDNMGWITPCDC